MLHQNSVNSKDVDFLYPWLVFTDKVKTSNVMIRDTTGVSDSMLLLFGGQVRLVSPSAVWHVITMFLLLLSLYKRASTSRFLLKSSIFRLICDWVQIACWITMIFIYFGFV